MQRREQEAPMAWFEDPRLKDICDRSIAAGLSSEECHLIRRKLIILMATRSAKSHWLAGTPMEWPGDRSAVQVTPGWLVTFHWIEDIGPFAMRLEPPGKE